jgi:hypothetical protein
MLFMTLVALQRPCRRDQACSRRHQAKRAAIALGDDAIGLLRDG